ncbi:DUF2161 domain-containing phosphodiesterase [Thioclava sp. FR2]|uniref:DUF2161 domain-containing phosphodiesterase n=1 Tax=Thioclava sp. FR2 TaxID=3445780 RepID=UPI003EC10070
MKESDLYPPIKAFLEGQGYEVKAEIGAADVMACRGDDPPLIVELKTALNLNLILQGVARQALFDDVYLAVPQPPKWTHRYKDLTALLRRLGLGLLTVRGGQVEVHLDPAPYQPRQNKARAGRMLREFQRRAGDPNTGGTTGVKRMTAYRQDALRLAAYLSKAGAASPSACAKETGVTRAAAILRADHYGWFDHPGRAVYVLSPIGRQALQESAPPSE